MSSENLLKYSQRKHCTKCDALTQRVGGVCTKCLKKKRGKVLPHMFVPGQKCPRCATVHATEKAATACREASAAESRSEITRRFRESRNELRTYIPNDSELQEKINESLEAGEFASFSEMSLCILAKYFKCEVPPRAPTRMKTEKVEL